MIAAFPVNPPVEGSNALQYTNLLEPSAELAAEGPSMEVDVPLLHPRMVIKLELPTAVYNKETDEVMMELQPFHFPYTAKVRSCCFKVQPTQLTSYSWTVQRHHSLKRIRYGL